MKVKIKDLTFEIRALDVIEMAHINRLIVRLGLLKSPLNISVDDMPNDIINQLSLAITGLAMQELKQKIERLDEMM